MKLKREIEQDGLVVTHFGGLHTYDDAIEALNELYELNKGEKSIYEIVINEDDIELEISKDEGQLLIGKVESTYEKFEIGALAIVANSDFVFGMSRRLEISIHNERIAISVFRSEGLARTWIQEIRDLHSQGPHAVGL
jgi:hypothetical protein